MSIPIFPLSILLSASANVPSPVPYSCSGYDRDTCLRQDSTFVNAPGCLNASGTDVAVPTGDPSETMCCFVSVEMCDEFATELNLEYAPGCNVTEEVYIYIVANATSTQFAQCSTACRSNQYLTVYPPLADPTTFAPVNPIAQGVCAPLTSCSGSIQISPPKCCSRESLYKLTGLSDHGNRTAIFQARLRGFETSFICNPPVPCVYGNGLDSPVCTERPCTQTNNHSLMVVTDSECLESPRVSSSKPSAGEDVGYALFGAVLLAAIFIVGCYVRRLKKEKIYSAQNRSEYSMKEMLLDSEIARLHRAWEIPADHITRISEIGSGGFATVWRGTWGHISVAIKCPHEGYVNILDNTLDSSLLSEFDAEATQLQSIRHPNLVTFYGAGKMVDGGPFLVFELMDQGSLKSILATEFGKSLSWNKRVVFASEIAAGMQHLHYLGVMHRDLKSENVLVDKDMHAKVADFGSATSKLTVSGTDHERERVSSFRSNFSRSTKAMTVAVGTPLWMAPELLSYGGEYGPEIDLYSYGIVMWELITNEEPWNEVEFENIMQFQNALTDLVTSGMRPSIPEGYVTEDWYVRLMKRCWGADPKSRPSFAQVSATIRDMTS